MEGLFFTEQPAAITIVGQPNMETLTIDNPIKIPGLLSFLTYRRFDAEVRGLTSFPRDEWPDLVPLVYYAYHIMITSGDRSSSRSPSWRCFCYGGDGSSRAAGCCGS